MHSDLTDSTVSAADQFPAPDDRQGGKEPSAAPGGAAGGPPSWQPVPASTVELFPGLRICVPGQKGACFVKDVLPDGAGFTYTNARRDILGNSLDALIYPAPDTETCAAVLHAWNKNQPLCPELGDEIARHPDGVAGQPHKVSIKVGDKYYPARISEALTAMPDWRTEPEYGRLVASAGRDQKFQQPVLGKLVVAGSKAMPVQYFEIEDGRHRFWAAEENQLAFIEGKLTDMPVAELMLRSLLERRHLTQGARAYLTWPVIQPFVAANKDARSERGKANLKRGKEKGDAPRNRTSTVSGEIEAADPSADKLSEAEEKTLREMAASYGISETLLSQAQRVHALFARRADLRHENEAAILAGDLGMGAFLAGQAGKDATEGKERLKTSPADLLRRSFRDLRIRFASDRWGEIPETDRPAVAGELVETVLDLPEDVRARLKLALA